MNSSASSFQGLANPKPVPQRRIKSRRKREAAAVVQAVRPQVVARDGYCRLSEAARLRPGEFGECKGPSQWSHYNATHRRSKTRGMPPEARHTTAGSMMLCTRHSEDYDQHRTDIAVQDEARGCNGPVTATRGGAVWIEEAA
jgi:hypothetical protein